MRIQLIVISLLLFTFTGCLNNKSNVNQKDAYEDNAFKTVNLIGTYEGSLPCADCDAITTLLTLNQDKTYIMTYVYSGKSAETFEKKGNWKVDKGILILDGEDYFYKIGNNFITQLDLSGKEISGPLAEKYQLKKL
ncbi:copper resistance protein NlpE [Sphingobacterium hungaricum]|uniref:Copper resistance protein NlpE n=1 Tax=Sphingobacterium hungaricum TaxID=2082723 RepID=A0A928UZ41_9SPHI|nr:copper resistance protein NlpE [Sphingobacterium hungaricum]MBE8714723.1 copper resistance protein NlpE [Sphingobacterium hungaricum]